MLVLSFAAAVLSTALLSISAGLMVLFWLLSNRFAATWQCIKAEPAAWFALGLVALSLIGLAYTPAAWSEAQEGAGKYVKLLILPLALFLFDDVRWIRRALYAFLAALAVAVFASYLEGYGLIPDWTAKGDSTAFAGHITLSLFEALGAFIAFTLARFEPARRVLWLLLGVFLLSHLFVLNTGRTGQLLALIMLGVLALQVWRWKGLLVGGLAAVVLVSLAWFGSAQFQMGVHKGMEDLQQYRQGNAQTSLGARVDFWQTSLKIAQDAPFIGHGTASLKTLYPGYASGQGWMTDNAHNEYLMVAVQWGGLGLLLLLGLLFAALLATRTMSPQAAAITWGVMTAYGLGSLFNSLLLDHREGMFFALLLGLLLAWRKDASA